MSRNIFKDVLSANRTRLTYEEDRRITSSEDTKRTMEENQYQYHWTIIKVKQKGCHCSHYRLIHKDDSS